MKVPLKVFVIWEAPSKWQEACFKAWSCDVSKTDPRYALATETEVIVDIPDDFDPTSKIIATMREQQKNILATAQVQSNNIEDQIQRMLCIEHKPEVQS